MRCLIAACLALACGAAPAAAQQIISPEGGTIVIDGDELELLDAEQVARWIGNVDARQGDSRLLADRMDIFFSKAGSQNQADITRIEATGSVRYITPDRNARADRGVYVAQTRQIEMCGNVTIVVRGTDTVAGECLIVEPESGSTRLLTSPDDRGDRSKQRVRGVFYPSDYGEGEAQR
jgi:lipopolysaccharide export system protein LptA